MSTATALAFIAGLTTALFIWYLSVNRSAAMKALDQVTGRCRDFVLWASQAITELVSPGIRGDTRTKNLNDPSVKALEFHMEVAQAGLIYPRDKEEKLVRAALGRIKRAQEKGKVEVKLRQDELIALETRRACIVAEAEAAAAKKVTADVMNEDRKEKEEEKQKGEKTEKEKENRTRIKKEEETDKGKEKEKGSKKRRRIRTVG